MSTSHVVTRDEHGEPVVTITLTGESDIHRFSFNSDQVEFAEVGRNILKSQRRRLGKARWVGMWRTFHGENSKPLTFSWKRDL